MVSPIALLYNAFQILVLTALEVYTLLDYSNELSTFEYVHYIISTVLYSVIFWFHIFCIICRSTHNQVIFISIPAMMMVTVINIMISSYTLDKLFDSNDYLPVLESFISIVSIAILLQCILMVFLRGGTPLKMKKYNENQASGSPLRSKELFTAQQAYKVWVPIYIFYLVPRTDCLFMSPLNTLFK